ncbi:MAG: hypothetical protein ACE5I3_10090, partial [Phycisphaerae bacterium]
RHKARKSLNQRQHRPPKHALNSLLLPSHKTRISRKRLYLRRRERNNRLLRRRSPRELPNQRQHHRPKQRQ